MSPAHVLEPTYRRLKRALMEGTWPGGTRLEALRLADEFGVSMTPVRDSLNQLVGEGFVDLTPGEGFRVAILNERALRDLLQMNALLLETAAGAHGKTTSVPDPESGKDAYADRLAAAFSFIAAESDNRLLADFVARIGERLHPVRSREPEVLPAAWEMLKEIEDVLLVAPENRIPVLRRYHGQCQEWVPRLINCLPG